MAYPSSIDSFTTVAGTDLVASVPSGGHAVLHNNTTTAVSAIETVLGTTAGTSIAKNFAAGDFPARINSTNVLQQALSGTINNSVFGTPAITGGTINNMVVGTPAVTGGTLNPGVYQIAGLVTSQILQVVLSTSTTQKTATNQDTETWFFEGTITPKSASSTIYLFVTVNGIDNAGAGRMITYCKHGPTAGSGNLGTATLGFTEVAADSTNTAGLMSTGMILSHNHESSTTTRYYKITGAHTDSSVTWYMNRYNDTSSILMVEVL